MISASMVKELRETTGAGMLDCKKALEANNGDFDKALALQCSCLENPGMGEPDVMPCMGSHSQTRLK